MIIIPTEKRFDWKHAPLVLFCIVLLNTLVFFFYQSSDADKYEQALSLYAQNRFFEFEWPAYRAYLTERDRSEEASEYQSLLDQGQELGIAVQAILERDFYQYLLKHQQTLIPPQQREVWVVYRAKIDKLVGSVSAIALGLTPNELNPITLISYQFLHADTMHLLGNMFFLVICGFAVEAAIGHLYFLIFYLLAGIIAGLSHAALDFSSTTALIGASGAVSGVMAMYLGIFRFRKIEFFYWFYVFVGYFRAPALFILLLYIGKELFSFYFDADSSVAFMAHAGGFVAGAMLIGILLLVQRGLLNEEYIEEDQDHNPFQEKLAKVYRYFEQFRFDQAVTVLDEIIAGHGLTFELAVLRCNLMKATKPKGYQDAVIELLKLKRLAPIELKKLEEIWRENPAVQQDFDQDELINLGMRFSTSDHLKTAESIFQQLHKNSPSSQALVIFARKLALVHGQLQNGAKQRQYDDIATTLSGGAV